MLSGLFLCLIYTPNLILGVVARDRTSNPPNPDPTFATVFNRAPLYLAITSLETGKFLEVNAAFTKATGYRYDEAVDKTAEELNLWVDPEVRRQGYEQLSTQGYIEEMEARFRTKGGKVCTFLISAELIEFAGKWGVLNTAVDVTESKQTEASLRESRARLSFILESSRIGNWDLDLTTGQARTSLRHDRCFGATEPFAEWSYDTFLSYVHPDDRERVDRAFQQAVAERGDWHFECRVVWADESVHWIEAHGSHYRSAEGEVTHMLGSVTDITRHKDNETTLRS